MTGPKLLLVEDDIFIGMDMAHTLSESGYDPVQAKSLDEAEHAIHASAVNGSSLSSARASRQVG